MKVKLVDKNLYIHGDFGFKKVKGKRCKIHGLKMFSHKFGEGFCISDTYTGTRLSKVHKTEESAIKFAEKFVEKKGKKTVSKQIVKKIKEIGLSPRYEFVIDKKAK